MKSRVIAGLVLVMIVAWATASFASYPYSGWQKGPWEKSDVVDRVTLYKNSSAPGDYSAYRADTVIDAPPAKVFPLIISHERARSWSFMKKYRVITEQENGATVYQMVDRSGLSPRDFTIRSYHFEPDSPNEGTYGFVWEQANKAGPGETSSAVRVEHVGGSLILEPADGGKKTRVSYRFLMDPGTWVPGFIVNGALKDSALEVIEKLREDVNALP